MTTAGPLYELQPLEPDTRPDAKVASTITPCGTSVFFPDTAKELRRQLTPSIVPPVPPAGLGELPAAVQAAVATAIAPMANGDGELAHVEVVPHWRSGARGASRPKRETIAERASPVS